VLLGTLYLGKASNRTKRWLKGEISLFLSWDVNLLRSLKAGTPSSSAFGLQDLHQWCPTPPAFSGLQSWTGVIPTAPLILRALNLGSLRRATWATLP
jgi:hypothetical protein